MIAPHAPPLLVAEGLAKSYGGSRVVDDLALSVHAGEVLGLLGPNGAGKTTTLRMLYGFLEPEAGHIRYLGRDFATDRAALKRIIGVCTQEDTIDEDFSVAQNLRVYASYFRPKVEDLEARIAHLLEAFDLTRYANARPDTLSGGYKRRLLIARSVIHRPRVLFLDEPTTGLDPRARVDLWELVAGMRSEGMGIVLTTHYMDEAERLSDELLVLRRGRSVARGKPREVLGDLLGEHVLVLPPGMEHARRTAVEELLVAELRVRPALVLGELRAPLTAAQLATLSERFPEVRFEVRAPTLDDLFLQLADEGPGS